VVSGVDGWWVVTPHEAAIAAGFIFRYKAGLYAGTFYYRWVSPEVREELCFVYDGAGRLQAWSVWHNQRVVAPDQEKGRRKRLEDWLQRGES
jgi:hypothetical protein